MSDNKTFIANISHEIRTPINTILGMNEMILREDRNIDPEVYADHVTGYAKDIKKAAGLLLTLVNNVLDLMKAEAGEIVITEKDYDTREFFSSVASVIRVFCSEKDLSFDTEIDKDLPKTLRGDSGRIRQVLLNILINAVEYTGQGGCALKVAVDDRDENSCTVKYSVYSSALKSDRKEKEEAGDSGVGMDVSERLISLMGGTLSSGNIQGKGSFYSFGIKQGIADATPMGDLKGDDASEDGSRPLFLAPEAKILVVDDNEMNLQVIRGLLKRTKAQLTTVLSGRECLDRLKEESFHVVILDHMMPGMSGLETVSEIRKIRDLKDLPVIALTANAANSGAEFYKNAGFDDYQAKPVEPEGLERTIKKYLPEEIVTIPDDSYVPENDNELPENAGWLYKTKGISVPDGIRFCGGAEPFLKSINTFYEMIEENLETIRNALKDGDLGLYTVKVHALKSSARIIGASELSEKARLLEDAGNSGDTDYIRENTEEALSLYRDYLDILSPLSEKDDQEKELLSGDDLKGAYEALRELIPQMDYDGVEMILDNVKEYRLEAEDQKLFTELEKKLKVLDWEKMGELLK